MQPLHVPDLNQRDLDAIRAEHSWARELTDGELRALLHLMRKYHSANPGKATGALTALLGGAQ